MTNVKPLKVLYPFIGDSVGGAQVSAATLIRNLPDHIEAQVVLLQDGPLAPWLRERGIEPHILELGINPVGRNGGILKEAIALWRTTRVLRPFLKGAKPDIVHSQEVRSHLTWSRAAKAEKIASLWHQRSLYAPSRLYGWQAGHADHIACISNGVKQSLPSDLQSKASVIHNPFEAPARDYDRAAARTKLLSQLQRKDDPFIVAHFANYTRQKRPDLFIQIAKAVKEQRPGRPIAFCFFGRNRDGLQNEWNRLAIDLQVYNEVQFLPFAEDIFEGLAGVDLHLATGVGEGFGRTLIEAMMVETPVLASPSGGHLEIIQSGQNGFLPDQDTPDSYAKIIADIMDDPAQAKQIAAESKVVTMTKYGVEAHVERIVSLYQQLRRGD